MIITDLSEYTAEIPKGCIKLLGETKLQSKPILVKSYWAFVAIYSYGLTNIRIYKEGYLDKVMVSGVNAYGRRERVYLDKYPKRKKSRNRWFHTKEK